MSLIMKQDTCNKFYCESVSCFETASAPLVSSASPHARYEEEECLLMLTGDDAAKEVFDAKQDNPLNKKK